MAPQIVTLTPEGDRAPAIFSVCRASRAVASPAYMIVMQRRRPLSFEQSLCRRIRHEMGHKSSSEDDVRVPVFINPALDFLYLTTMSCYPLKSNDDDRFGGAAGRLIGDLSSA